MAKWQQGFFTPKNPQKYAGTKNIRFRSGWELSFMNFCDNNEHIVSWASEPIRIPYKHPLTGKITTYVPDFIVVYRDRGNATRAELIEIKPKKQSVIESKASSRDRAVVAINYAKWAAAQRWCKQNGLHFRIITEDQMFHQGSKRK
jgi:hypothetical protein